MSGERVRVFAGYRLAFWGDGNQQKINETNLQGRPTTKIWIGVTNAATISVLRNWETD